MFSTKDAKEKLLSFIHIPELFELYRFVDPVTNTVYDFQDDKMLPICQKCYEVWHRNRPCANCISMRAVRDGKPVFKLETLDNTTFLIVAMPTFVHESVYSLELISDVTNSLAIYNAFQQENSKHIGDIISDLNYVVTHDTFTALYNKVHAEEEIVRVLHRAQETGVPMTMSVMDIDHFKSINDTYGHTTGDVVIKTVVHILKQTMEEMQYGWAARIGGDEFLLLFENRTFDEAKEICHQIDEQIKAYAFEKKQEIFHIDVSIGIRQFDNQKDKPEEFLDLVDCAMYEQKHQKQQ